MFQLIDEVFSIWLRQITYNERIAIRMVKGSLCV